MNVLWFSAGVSSAIVAYLCRNELDRIIYQHIDDQDKDSLRFLHDVEILIGRKIEVRQSPYCSVENVCTQFRFLVSAKGAKCTDILKRRERKLWELENPGRHKYYWGYDCDEAKRVTQLEENMPHFDHCFPLVERNLIKEDAHAMMKSLKVKRPRLYDMGYQNNNCKCCLKGGMGYHNRMRKDFPDDFVARARLERKLGHTILKRADDSRLYLDELDPKAGRDEPLICEECGIMCEIGLRESGAK